MNRLYFLCFLVDVMMGAPFFTNPSQPGGTDQDNHRGLGVLEFKAMEMCVKRLKVKTAREHHQSLKEDEVTDLLFGDIAVTAAQCQQMEEQYNTRHRRKAIDFSQYPQYKWSGPLIKYSLDSRFEAVEITNINKAISYWEENTCIRFQQSTDTPRLDIRRNPDGCWSYVGFIQRDIQPLNLQGYGCTIYVGIPAHELGHALGMYHEQSRPDRDNYVTINTKVIIRRALSNFDIATGTTMHSVPYDYSSVMHYGRDDFSRKSTEYVIVLKQPEYNYITGQRVAPSYMDYSMMNRMYDCHSDCSAATITCQNGGYPNPGKTANCGSCKCPDGLGGDCTTAASGSSGCSPTSGDITVTQTTEVCLTSPNYGSGQYTQGDTCSWLLTASPSDKSISVRFDRSGNYGLPYYSRSGGVCDHWVEIKYNGNLTFPGPKYCGDATNPLNMDSTVVSTGDKILVHFWSDHPKFESSRPQYGFRLCYKLVDGPTPPPSSTTTTTTPGPVSCIKYNPKGKCLKYG